MLLADHSKFGKTATYAHGDVSAFSLVVTDTATPESEIEAMRGLGTEVRVVAAEATIPETS